MTTSPTTQMTLSEEVRERFLANESRSRAVVDADANTIQIFVSQYMLDNGVGVQMLEAISRELFGQTGTTVPSGTTSAPQAMLSGAVQDVIDVNAFTGATFDLQRVVKGAASLEFLVRYARKLDDKVMPREMIPSADAVEACLHLFHIHQINSFTGAPAAS